MRLDVAFVLLEDFWRNFVGLRVVYLPLLPAWLAEGFSEAVRELASFFEVYHARPDAATASLVREAIAIFAWIVAVERRKLAVEPAFAERLGTCQLVALCPFDINATDVLLDGLGRRDALAVAVLDALHAAVADLSGVDRVGIEFGVRQHDGETLPWAKLRGKERARVAKLSEPREKRGHAEIDGDIGRREPGTDGAAPPLAEVSGKWIDGLATADVRHGHCLVAVVFHVAVHLPQYHRPVYGVESGIAHRSVVEVVRAFLDTAERSARNAKAEDDHRLRVREYVARIVLLVGDAFPSGHWRDANDVGAAFECLCLYFG